MKQRRLSKVQRRTYLGVLAASTPIFIAGCVGNIDKRNRLAVDRDASEGSGCREVELVDESLRLYPRYSPIGSAGVSWPIDLEAAEALRISVFWWGERNRVMPLPDLRLSDPDGNAILDESGYSTNHHTIGIERNGSHELWIRNRRRSEGGRWKIELTWYPHVDCV